MKKLLILTLFFFSVSFAQIEKNITVYRGDSTRIEFKANGNITTKGIVFVVKLSKSFSSPRLIQKKNLIAGGSAAEITAVFSAPQTKVTVILGPEHTQDLTGATYYYDIVAADAGALESYSTFNYGIFKVIQDVQTPFDGTALPEDGTRITTVSLPNGTLQNESIAWDTTLNQWVPAGFVFSTEQTIAIDSVSDALKSELLAKEDTSDFRAYSDSKYLSVNTILVDTTIINDLVEAGIEPVITDIEGLNNDITRIDSIFNTKVDKDSVQSWEETQVLIGGIVEDSLNYSLRENFTLASDYAPVGTAKDGTVDWTDYIQDALNTGKSVILGEGLYRVSGLRLKSRGQYLIGVKAPYNISVNVGSKLVPVNAGDTLLIFNNANFNGKSPLNMGVENIHFQGFYDGDSAKIGVYFDNMAGHSVKNCSFTGFFASDTSYAIYNYSTFNTHILFNQFFMNTYTLYMEGGCQSSQIIGNVFGNSIVNSLTITGGGQYFVSGNNFETGSTTSKFDCHIKLQNVGSFSIDTWYSEVGSGWSDTSKVRWMKVSNANSGTPTRITINNGEFSGGTSGDIATAPTVPYAVDITACEGLVNISIENSFFWGISKAITTDYKENVKVNIKNSWHRTVGQSQYFIDELSNIKSTTLGNWVVRNILRDSKRSANPAIFERDKFYDHYAKSDMTFYKVDDGKYFEGLNVYESIYSDGNDTIYIPHASISSAGWNNTTNSFTQLLWVKPSSGFNTPSFLFRKGTVTTPRYQFGYVSNGQTNNEFYGRFIVGTNNYYLYSHGIAGNVSTYPHFDEGVWHLLAFTRDSANQTLTLYIDGVARDTVSFPESSLGNTNSLDFLSNLKGSMHSFANYNKALSDAEIDSVYNGGVPIDLQSYPSSIVSNLKEYFYFKDIDEGVVIDTAYGKVNSTLMYLGGTTANSTASIVQDDPSNGTVLRVSNDSEDKDETFLLRRDGTVRHPYNVSYQTLNAQLTDNIWLITTDYTTAIDSIWLKSDDSVTVQITFGKDGTGTDLWSSAEMINGEETITSFTNPNIPKNNEAYLTFSYIGDSLTNFRWKIYWRK